MNSRTLQEEAKLDSSTWLRFSGSMAICKSCSWRIFKYTGQEYSQRTCLKVFGEREEFIPHINLAKVKRVKMIAM